MMYLINISIIVVAILLAIETYTEKRAKTASVILIVIGIAIYITEFAYANCEIEFNMRIITAIDSCLDYESIPMFIAQTSIIAGATVLIVRYFISKQPNNALKAGPVKKRRAP